MSRVVEPSIRETAFSCPYCGALTTQYWHKLFASRISDKRPIPVVPSQAERSKLVTNATFAPDKKQDTLKWVDRMLSGLVFFEEGDTDYSRILASNLHLSKCYNCGKIAVWIHDTMVFPRRKAGTEPIPELPPEVARDFEEAREIVDASPRGAAALLRLCVQKLCQHLGEKGKNIDDDIASLVRKGLNPLVQKSLDIVRVIGNEAVHPGELDLKDDRDTAIRLLEIVNAIADQMISHPKTIRSMYDKLPESKRKAIEDRDAKMD